MPENKIFIELITVPTCADTKYKVVAKALNYIPTTCIDNLER